MTLRPLLLACAASAAAFGLMGCVADGGYGYGYSYDYVGPAYVGPDLGFYSGFWGPDDYIGPGHFHGRYRDRRDHDHDRDHGHGDDHDHPHFFPYRTAPGGRRPPSLPHGFAHRGAIPHGGRAPRAGDGAFHGRGNGPHH
ncbi:MAG TPA: hypothetical protein VID71_06355 [Steroidobacteraceae bacterium]|jgi:hypothetical protein